MAENPRPVRGTVRIQKAESEKSQPSTSNVKKTILIDRPESIFSFFGGAKKKELNEAESVGRPTIVINKKDGDWLSGFSLLNSGNAADREEKIEEPVEASTNVR